VSGSPDGRVEQLHLGVVTSDMGTGGFAVPTCHRADFGGDGVLRTEGNRALADCMETYPPFLTYRPGSGSTEDEFVHQVFCVSSVGTGGCGFEQQLEAGLEALSPAAATEWTADGYEPPLFFRNTFGHGDRANEGFVRDDSVLVVLTLTDESDCSARDPELFDPSSPTYGATDLNLRCFAHADAALHPVSRYVEGLLQLRRYPQRLVFAPIVGIPVDLEPSPRERPDWPRLTSPDESVRDPRLVERIDPTMPTRLVPSCNVPGRGVAYPPLRILRTAERLEARGARVALGSICQPGYDTTMHSIVHQIWR